MKRVYSTDDRIQAGYIHSALENRNIHSWIKNNNLSGAIGELPPIECWPEVWIHDDQDYQLAKEIINELTRPKNFTATAWECRCGENIEAQFQICWQCGSECPGP